LGSGGLNIEVEGEELLWKVEQQQGFAQG